jgi:hypothetical protein
MPTAPRAVVAQERKRGNPEVEKVPSLEVADVARVTGMGEGTIIKHTRHPELPWPTTVLQEAAAKLRAERRLETPAAAAAQHHLEAWLANPAGPVRAWCRQTRPRLLAACALLRASRDAGANAGHGTIVREAKEPLSAKAAVAAVGAGGNDEAAAAFAVEAALAALPATA